MEKETQDKRFEGQDKRIPLETVEPRGCSTSKISKAKTDRN